MGSTGDPPVPVGDPPTGTSMDEPSRRSSSFAGYVLPSGESPDGTGQWPVLPKTHFPHALLTRGVAPASTAIKTARGLHQDDLCCCNIAATSVCPRRAAHASGVAQGGSSGRFGRAPRLRRNSTMAVLP